jgi:hypothetical protein
MKWKKISRKKSKNEKEELFDLRCLAWTTAVLQNRKFLEPYQSECCSWHRSGWVLGPWEHNINRESKWNTRSHRFQSECNS